MFFKFLTSHDDDADTGTYADGAIEATDIDVMSRPRRLREDTAHQRDYGHDRAIAPAAAGFA
ncbi:hypothetical protein [Pararhizobium gei]|uniref:hypothetical protein n=1 Tax=Pararhizobium gei TaxID=1395951 RepID=UPI0023DA7A1B|nr:hypothetical protein [Rhizobium gei]